MDLVDDVDFVLAAHRAVDAAGDELARIIDRVVAGAVDLDDVGVLAGHDGLFDLGRAARVEGLGEDAGHGGLADASGAGKEVGVGDAVGGDGGLERSGDGFLADDVVEPGRAVPACESGV